MKTILLIAGGLIIILAVLAYFAIKQIKNIDLTIEDDEILF